MIYNYFKILWRSIWNNKLFSGINITGLSVALTCCILMVLYLKHELSYDKFQEKGDRIVRVVMEYSFSDGPVSKDCVTSTKVLPSFRRNFEEVEDGVRMAKISRLVKYEDNAIDEKNFLYADSTFFNVFSSFKLVAGDAKHALSEPGLVVVSKSTANKYFKDVHAAIGKTLLIGSDQKPYLVSAVCEDIPSNSQIKFDFLASFSTLGVAQERTYWNANYITYLLLNNKNSIAQLQSKIGPFMKNEMSAEGESYLSYVLEPYTKVHLHSAFNGFESNGNIVYIYIISGITLLLLTIACFTYINISTARSIERAKEVGVRKVSGAFGSQIFYQFIGESLILTLFSLIISLFLAGLLLPNFNQLTGLHFTVSSYLSADIIGISLAMVLVIALLAGAYPALVLARFQPIKVLKGSFKHTGNGVFLQKSLISFQFIISVFLIISTLVTGSQLKYIQEKKLGYDRSQVIVMNVDSKIREKIDLFKSMLKQNDHVLNVSTAYDSPLEIKGGYSMFRGDADVSQSYNTKANPVDEDFLETNGIELLAGEDISHQDVLDIERQNEETSYPFVLNETAVRLLGWSPEEAVGQNIYLGSERPGKIKGVIKDFHFASLHHAIEPLVLFPDGWRTTAMIKISGKNISETTSFIGGVFNELAPYRPFEYHFMDDDFNNMYQAEQNTAFIFKVFSIIAILLACLGLFAVSAYAAGQRIKEIGIRKALGASVSSITFLLSGNFMKLVSIAFLIASPLAWYTMSQWLQDFEYRIDLNWMVFLLAGMGAMSITLLTVSFHAIKAAIANPVKSLRSE